MGKIMKTFLFWILVFIMAGQSLALYTDGSIPPLRTTYNPDRKRPPINITVNAQYSTHIKSKLDSVPAMFEVISDEATGDRVKLSVFAPDMPVTVYELNLKNEEIAMQDASGTRTLRRDDPNDVDVYFTVLHIMQNYQPAVYGRLGLEYDHLTNTLSIDEETYKDALNVPQKYSLTSYKEGDILKVKVSDGSNEIVCGFDQISGGFDFSDNIRFADAYYYDQTAGPGLAAINDPYSGGVSASGLSDTLANWYLKKYGSEVFSIIRHYIESRRFLYAQSGKVIQQQYGLMKNIENVVKEPMARPVEPDIADIQWVNKANGIIRILGTADRKDSADMKIYIKTPDGATLIVNSNLISWAGNNWQVVNNYSTKLKPGHNKINVIVSKSDNREVESGDASVYIGQAGEPDLILVSPRDRDIFLSSDFPNIVSTFIRFKGRSTPGGTIRVANNSYFVDSSELFDVTWQIDNLNEGENNIVVETVASHDINVPKRLIGAFLFNSRAKNKLYILRRGDLVFNGTSPAEEGFKKGFPSVPLDPDHTGIYTGDGQITEAVAPFIKTTPMKNWDDQGFYYATQVPKLVNETARKAVCEKVKSKIGVTYKWPLHPMPNYGLPITIAGYYKPGYLGYYCSELAFWAWSEVSSELGFSFGINKQDLYFPMRYNGTDAYNSVLPAYLCEKSMEVKTAK